MRLQHAQRSARAPLTVLPFMRFKFSSPASFVPLEACHGGLPQPTTPAEQPQPLGSTVVRSLVGFPSSPSSQPDTNKHVRSERRDRAKRNCPADAAKHIGVFDAE